MRAIAFEYGGILITALWGILTLGIGLRIKSNGVVIASIVLGPAVGLLSLWTLSQTGKDLPATILGKLACTMFPDGANCVQQRDLEAKAKMLREESLKNEPSEKQPPTALVAPGSQAGQPVQPQPVQPQPVQPQSVQPQSVQPQSVQPRPSVTNAALSPSDLFGLDFDDSYEGWWRIGKPGKSKIQGTTETDLWNLTEKHPGACEPFRAYLGAFPSGAHASEAKNRLDGHRIRSAQVSKDFRIIALPVITSENLSNKTEADACTQIIRMNSAGSAGSCFNAKMVLKGRFGYFNGVDVLEREQAIIENCTCTTSNQSTFSCHMSAYPVCTIRVTVDSDLEACN